MANQTIISYLKENKEKFPISELKKVLISGGYKKEEIEEAVGIVEGKVPPPPLPSSSEKATAKGFLSSVFDGIKIPANQHPFYIEAMKLGAIGSVVSQLISAITSFLAWGVLFGVFVGIFGTFAGYYGYDNYGFNMVSFISGLFWSVIMGAIGTVIFIRFVMKYWPKFLGKTLFARLFYLNLIITVFFGGLMGVLASIFFPPILFTFIIIIIGSIIASYVNAKIIAGGLEKKYPEILKEVLAQ